MSEDKKDDIVGELHKLHLKAKGLCQRSDALSKIDGMPKLFRKCKAELQFLDRILRTPEKVSRSHLSSSNLAHLQGILEAVDALSDVVQVLRPFRLPGVDHQVHVDVVCNHGSTWVKVIARNSKALLMDTTGQQAFGEKTILDQVEQLLELAQLHPYNYTPPCIVFLFFHEVPFQLQQDLKMMGVTVREFQELSGRTSADVCKSEVDRTIPAERLNSDLHSDSNVEVRVFEGKKLDDSYDMLTKNPMSDCAKNGESGLQRFCSDACICAKYFGDKENIPGACTTVTNPAIPVLNKVNLDITTLFALVSNLCHGRCELVFQEKILMQQAIEERSRPLLPELLSFLRGKQLFVCQTALDDFQKILSTVGGPNEKERARVLLQYVTIVLDSPSPRSLRLHTTSKLSSRAKTIFGTGDFLKAVTTTANQGFARAAAQFSMDFVVFVHGARALTEQKESTATKYQSTL